MYKHTMSILLLWLIVTSWADPLGLIINELNTRDTSLTKESEFVELKSLKGAPARSLQGYYLVGIRGKGSAITGAGSTIELIANLWNHNLQLTR